MCLFVAMYVSHPSTLDSYSNSGHLALGVVFLSTQSTVFLSSIDSKKLFQQLAKATTLSRISNLGKNYLDYTMMSVQKAFECSRTF